MTAPAAAAGALAAAVLLGMGLGVWNAMLTLLRPRHTGWADGLFVLGVFGAWVYLGFGICGGDLRIFQLLGLGAGALGFRITLGAPAAGVFRRIGRAVGGFFELFPRFFHELQKKLKICFASGGK